MRRPADSCCPGLTPAQEHRWAAVGKAVMSAPVSAMMMSATVRLTPEMLVSRSRGASRELIFCSIRCSTPGALKLLLYFLLYAASCLQEWKGAAEPSQLRYRQIPDGQPPYSVGWP